MDMGTSVESSTRQKICEGQCSDESEDRISHLPDNVLHYILSFLPTKYAVVTSVLSTRWNYLWTSIHNLDFCDRQLYTGSKSKNYAKRKTLFRDFVDRVLLLTGVSNINIFSLACKVCNATYFNKWITTVTRRKVEELVISIPDGSPRMFLNWIFSCESLKILKIQMKEQIKIPALLCFSSLKILHLEYIDFSSDREVQEISLIFPNLEELVMIYCRWLEIKTVNIVVPTLRMLTIKEPSWDVLRDCEIKIDAERLVSLKFRSDFKYNYSLCHLLSLVDASVDVCHSSEIVRVGSFLREISNVRDLELSIPSITEPDQFIFEGRIVGTTPQCFLSHLKLVDINFFKGIQKHTRFVKFWIKSARVMGNLTIKLGVCSEKSARWKEQITRELDIAKYPNCILQFCQSMPQGAQWL